MQKHSSLTLTGIKAVSLRTGHNMCDYWTLNIDYDGLLRYLLSNILLLSRVNNQLLVLQYDVSFIRCKLAIFVFLKKLLSLTTKRLNVIIIHGYVTSHNIVCL